MIKLLVKFWVSFFLIQLQFSVETLFIRFSLRKTLRIKELIRLIFAEQIYITSQEVKATFAERTPIKDSQRIEVLYSAKISVISHREYASISEQTILKICLARQLTYTKHDFCMT